MERTGARDRIRQAIAPGAGTEAIDRLVERDGRGLGEEDRAALWLYAWHHAKDPDRVARELRAVELLGARG
jgi:hypothetical protein